MFFRQKTSSGDDDATGDGLLSSEVIESIRPREDVREGEASVNERSNLGFSCRDGLL